MKTVIEMAEEAGGMFDHMMWLNRDLLPVYERIVELAQADERKANIGCIGRIAAMVVDPIDQARLYEAMDAIRARGNT